MSLYQVEELFFDKPTKIKALVDKLIKKKRLNQAYGICLRNNFLSNQPKYKCFMNDYLSKFQYDAKVDSRPDDYFGPIKEGALELPDDVDIKFVQDEKDIKILEELYGA